MATVTTEKTVIDKEPARSGTASAGPAKSSMVVVELSIPPSPPMAIKKLRKGKGKLYRDIEAVVDDMMKDGTVKAGAQPIVIIVPTVPMPPWMHGDDDD